MVGVNFFGNFDLASLSIWLFWIFFALLIYYLQTENMREGYPLENDDGDAAANQGPFPVPADKTFLLPHGQGSKKVPSQQTPERADLPLRRSAVSEGFPFEPTGDPMLDGVGPASWAPRQDVPEVDHHGHAKIRPMNNDTFRISAGTDPRGLPVVSADKVQVGTVTDLWVDEAEALVRYIAYERTAEAGGGTRLLPMTLARITGGRVMVKSLYAHNFAGVPATASGDTVTKLEEDKICGYYAGGHLYASQRRQDAVI